MEDRARQPPTPGLGHTLALNMTCMVQFEQGRTSSTRFQLCVSMASAAESARCRGTDWAARASRPAPAWPFRATLGFSSSGLRWQGFGHFGTQHVTYSKTQGYPKIGMTLFFCVMCLRIVTKMWWGFWNIFFLEQYNDLNLKSFIKCSFPMINKNRKWILTTTSLPLPPLLGDHFPITCVWLDWCHIPHQPVLKVSLLLFLSEQSLLLLGWRLWHTQICWVQEEDSWNKGIEQKSN